MKKKLISIALASSLLAGTAHNAYANNQDSPDDSNKSYIGAGIGAVAGALFAGPVGFIAGGLIGNLAGKHNAMNSDNMEQPLAANESQLQTPTLAEPAPAADDEIEQAIVVAQTGELDSVIGNADVDPTSALKDIMVNDLQLDVFFLSGSTSVETFYIPRIDSISRMMQELPDIDVHLEGYSDRRGDKDSNLALSNERLDAVRDELIQAGVDASRIQTNAFGEQQFVSKPGDLEAYTFDRRVVIRFEHSIPPSKSPVALVESTPAP